MIAIHFSICAKTSLSAEPLCVGWTLGDTDLGDADLGGADLGGAETVSAMSRTPMVSRSCHRCAQDN
jgi:hypothetical protein